MSITECRQVTKFQKLVNIHWHFSQFHKQTNTVTLDCYKSEITAQYPQTGESINDQPQFVLRPNDKLFITLLIKHEGGNTIDNVQEFIKVMVFITLLNKYRIDRTGDGLEKLVKVIVIHTFHSNYSKGMKLF